MLINLYFYFVYLLVFSLSSFFKLLFGFSRHLNLADLAMLHDLPECEHSRTWKNSEKDTSDCLRSGCRHHPRHRHLLLRQKLVRSPESNRRSRFQSVGDRLGKFHPAHLADFRQKRQWLVIFQSGSTVWWHHLSQLKNRPLISFVLSKRLKSGQVLPLMTWWSRMRMLGCFSLNNFARKIKTVPEACPAILTATHKPTHIALSSIAQQPTTIALSGSVL